MKTKLQPVHRSMNKPQQGIALLELLLYVGLFGLLMVGGIRLMTDRATSSEQGQAFAIAIQDVPTALAQVSQNNQRNYTAITADADGKRFLVGQGVRYEVPWKSATAAELGGWVVSTAGTAGPNATVELQFFCTDAKDPAQMCTNLANQIAEVAELPDTVGTLRDPNLQVDGDRVLTVTSVTLAADPAQQRVSGANTVTVTYGRPL